MGKKYNILLLTNRNSDNVGDQVIEACDMALIKVVMNNLNIDETSYKINSQPASIIGKEYLQTKKERFLKKVNKCIEKSDVVIFGGAPMFNYLYQDFYEQTATFLEIAKKYQKPVIFSAIGIEHYDEKNEKCQRLKQTLNFDCVKQITTRDGIEELRKYKTNEQMVIARVSDPAVFSAETFRNYTATQDMRFTSKKVGIFVFRANGFKDNKINFTRNDAVKLWKDIIKELVNKGYEYRLLTSGHFGDEAFLDYLIQEHEVDESKCIFNMNSPEKLLAEISSYDAVISCRLHPSIIAYSLNVPSIGIIWNPKVKHFYDCIGYPDRRMDVCDINAKEVVAKIEEAIGQKIAKDEDYLMSIYWYLFDGIKKALNVAEDEIVPYNYEELSERIPAYTGTTKKEQRKKLERKFRRIYRKLNARAEINANLKKEIHSLKEVTNEYAMSYFSSVQGEHVTLVDNWKTIISGKVNRMDSKVLKCTLRDKVKNDGSGKFQTNLFKNPSKEFGGWKLRFRSGNIWFWYLEDGSFCQKNKYDRNVNKGLKVFLPGEEIPCIPLLGIDSVVAEAIWISSEV